MGNAAFVANLNATDCEADDESGVLYLQSPSIEIPAGTDDPKITFVHWFQTESGWDGGNVKISVNEGPYTLLPTSAFEAFPYTAELFPALDEFGQPFNTNPMAGESAFTGTIDGGPTGSWQQSIISLMGIALAGDVIRLRFEFGIDVCNGEVGWYVDDLEVLSCTSLGDPELIFEDSFEAPLPDYEVIVELENYTLVNDNPSGIPFVLITDPPTPGAEIPLITHRVPRGGTASPVTESPGSIRMLQNGEFTSTIITDDSGVGEGTLVQGSAGQGFVVIELDGSEEFPVFLGAPPRECRTCPLGDTVEPFSGEFGLSEVDVQVTQNTTFTIRRTYSSQSANRRSIARNEIAADWAFSFISDYLVEDGNNIILFSDTNRTDSFVATANPNEFVSPLEYYEILRRLPSGDFELRSPGGTVKKYRSFSDPDIPGRLIRQEDRNGNFMSFLYDALPGSSDFVLTTAVDSMGRNIEFRYYSLALLHPGRRGRLMEIEDFRRDNSADGRTCVYDYDDEGNLISVTSPIVSGTPNGNDFPVGKTTRYGYLTDADIPGSVTGHDRERLLHNLVHIEFPNETATDLDPGNPQTLGTAPNTYRQTLTYGIDPSNPAEFDRVISHTIGGTNANAVEAGGTITYAYTVLDPYATSANDPFMETTIIDRRGDTKEIVSGPGGTEIESRLFTRGLRNGEPVSYDTAKVFNEDKETTQGTFPEGNSVAYEFDDLNPDRFQQGNVLAAHHFPGPRGADQPSLLSETTFEPIYQQVKSVTDARGLAISPPPPGIDACGRNLFERFTQHTFFDYQEGDPVAVKALLAAELSISEADVQARLDEAGVALGLGDLNGDGDTTPRIGGNIVRVEDPSVVLLPGSNQAAIEGDLCQEIVSLHGYDDFGNPVFMVDPEGNQTEYSYFPETDPDGDGTPSPMPADGRTLDPTTGGYLQQVMRDTVSSPERNNNTNPPPTNIATSYTYDDVGNITSVTDGRGIRTDFFVNELDQVVQTTRAASVPGTGPDEPLPLTAFAYLERVAYDFNDNVVRREVEDRGDTSDTGGFADYTTKYDLLDQAIERTEEVSIGQTLTHLTRYDREGHTVLSIQPEGNATSSIYDERDLLFIETRGSIIPPLEALGPPTPPYDPRGGDPSSRYFNYDANGNLVEEVDAEDTDGSIFNNSTTSGFGDVTRYEYDGYDRRVRVVDSVGNERLTQYDPVHNIVQTVQRGPIEGPSPDDLLGLGNVDLSIVENHHDELSRLVQSDTHLFMAAGVVTDRVIELADGALTPGDNKVSQRYEYDRKSRATFTIEDDLDTSRTDYDGVDRSLKRTDPEGNTVEYAYDDGGNLIESRETDVSQIGGIADELFLTTMFYDSLGRLQRSVDNLGQTFEFRYDSRGNQVARSDAQGPVTGATITRRTFPDGPLTVNAINDFGNVTLYYYDGIGRQVRSDRVLTATGQGSGNSPGADIFGVKLTDSELTTVLLRDVTQSADGLISVLSAWDDNSLQASLTDDLSNRTDYVYDNLNRRIETTKGICDAGSGLGTMADSCDTPTTEFTDYDLDHNVIAFEDENGSLTECSYDAINRPIECAVTRAPGVEGTTLQEYEFDGLSRMTFAADNNGSNCQEEGCIESMIGFAYDSLSRVVEEWQQIDNDPTRYITSGWESENQRVSLIYPNDREIVTTYDQLDRIDTIADDGAPMALVDYDYMGAGRVLERAYPINGTRMTYLNDAGNLDEGYDGLRRPIRLRHLRSDDSLVVGFEHDYDRMNNRLNEIKLHDNDNNEEYEYDSAYRLWSFDRPEPGAETPLHSQWTFDGVGNWMEVDSEVRTHSSFNEIVTRDDGMLINITSDENGNVTDDGSYEYTWDFKNRLRTVTRNDGNDLVATYFYDALNRRMRKVVDNSGALDGETDFFYDGWRVLEEREAVSEPRQQYVYGNYIDEVLVLDENIDGDPASANDPSDRRSHYHSNNSFSIHALTNELGEIDQLYLYDAYGAVTSSSSTVNNPFRYSGRRLDEESELLHFRNRQLDAILGRFLERDPSGYVDGPGVYSNYFSINGTDPLGLEVTRNCYEVACRLVAHYSAFDWWSLSTQYTYKEYYGTESNSWYKSDKTIGQEMWDLPLASISLEALVTDKSAPCCCSAEVTGTLSATAVVPNLGNPYLDPGVAGSQGGHKAATDGMKWLIGIGSAVSVGTGPAVLWIAWNSVNVDRSKVLRTKTAKSKITCGWTEITRLFNFGSESNAFVGDIQGTINYSGKDVCSVKRPMKIVLK